MNLKEYTAPNGDIYPMEDNTAFALQILDLPDFQTKYYPSCEWAYIDLNLLLFHYAIEGAEKSALISPCNPVGKFIITTPGTVWIRFASLYAQSMDKDPESISFLHDMMDRMKEQSIPVFEIKGKKVFGDGLLVAMLPSNLSKDKQDLFVRVLTGNLPTLGISN